MDPYCIDLFGDTWIRELDLKLKPDEIIRKNIGGMPHFCVVMPVALYKWHQFTSPIPTEGRTADILLSSELERKRFKGIVHMPEDIAPDIAFP